MTSIKTIGAAIATLSALGLAQGAQAQDYKDHSGNTCKAYFASNTANIDARSDGVYNRGTTSTWVSCPIVRDDHLSPTNGTSALWVNVHAPASGLRCYATSRGRNASTLESRNDATTSAADRWLNLDLSKGATWGQYALYCYMPKGSRIHAYFVGEFQEE